MLWSCPNFEKAVAQDICLNVTIVIAAFHLKTWTCFLLFEDVIMEHSKIRREAQEAKRRAGEAKQEVETGSVKTADPTELNSQLISKEHKDTEPKDDASSKGKSELYIQYSLNQSSAL